MPLPASVVGQIKKTWATEIKTSDGKTIYSSK